MAKNKTVFVCSNCGYESPKWMGKCPACNEWNSFYEEKVVSSNSSKSGNTKKELTKPIELNKIEGKKESRISTGFNELDRVLGGGMVNRFFNIIRWRTRNWKVYINTTNL